jgi:hypothetical protein
VATLQLEDGCLLGCSTLVNFYQTTRRYNPEDSHLRTHRRDNLKSYTATVSDIVYFLKIDAQSDLLSI